MQRRTTIATLAIAGVTALVAGCGASSSGTSASTSGSTASTSSTSSSSSGGSGSSSSPATELSNAVAALGNSSTLTATVKLDFSADTIKSLAGSSMTDAEAKTITGAGISIEVVAPNGKKLSDVSSADSAQASENLAITENGSSFFTVREVNKTVYLQADVKALLNDIGKGNLTSTLNAESAELPPFVAALLKGNWVSLPDSAAKSLTGSTGATASPDAAQQQAFLSSLQKVLTKDVTVTRTSSGGTDNLVLTGNLKTISADVTQSLASVPGASAALGKVDPSTAPNKTITIDAQVKNGTLTQISLDLGQLTKKPAKLPIEIDFSTSGSSISAPSGAVAVDPSELGGLLGAASSG